jgi:hypothetical protein
VTSVQTNSSQRYSKGGSKMKVKVYDMEMKYQVHNIPTDDEIVIIPAGKFQVMVQIRHSNGFSSTLLINGELPQKVEILN